MIDHRDQVGDRGNHLLTNGRNQEFILDRQMHRRHITADRFDARFADIDIQTEPGPNPDEAHPEAELGIEPLDLEDEVRKFIREQAG